MKNKTFHIPVFIPHKGCPHDCVFCNQRKITGKKDDVDIQKVKTEINEHLETIEKNNAKGTYYVEIAFFGGSFTAIDKTLMEELLKTAHEYVKANRVDGIRCSTRPDAINTEILTLCKKYSMTAIELGVQSADEEVLKLSERGHTFDDVKKASQLIKGFSIELGIQQMTGLPGDTYEKSIETAKKIVALSPDCVRIYPTLVMKDTRLYDMYKDGTYKAQEMEETINLCKDLVKIFNKANIKILRLGLQSTETLKDDIASGPYHEAFAELVYSRLERDEIEQKILSERLKDTVLYIDAEEKKISQIIGHKKENIAYFKEKYNITLKLNHKK